MLILLIDKGCSDHGHELKVRCSGMAKSGGDTAYGLNANDCWKDAMVRRGCNAWHSELRTCYEAEESIEEHNAQASTC